MKLLLINPTLYSQMSFAMSFGEPLGLAYVAAAILQDGRHEVEIIDSLGASETPESVDPNGKYRMGLLDDQLFEKLSTIQFDAIAVAAIKYEDTNKELFETFSRIKKSYPKIPLIVGGPDATIEWQYYADNADIDYVIRGEGEQATIQLLNALSGEGDLKGVSGLVYRDAAGSLVKNGFQNPLAIDELPLPARHMLPMENYFKLRPAKYYQHGRVASMVTSRACPFDCSFCNIKAIWTRTWRGRSPKNVVDEMEMLKKDYGVGEILIQDPNFITDVRRVDAICDEIIQRKLNIFINIPPGLYLGTITKDLLTKLKRAGLYRFVAQVETGNPKTLKYIDKHINFDHAREIMMHANRLGLWTKTNIILGFHFETLKDIEESVRVAESLHVDEISYVPLMVMNKTKVYDDYLELGLIKEGEPYKNPVATEHLTHEQILSLAANAQKMHYINRALELVNPIEFYRQMYPKLNSFQKLGFLFRRIIT